MSPSSHIDAEGAVERVRRGEKDAFVALVEAYHRQIRSLLTVLVRDPDDVLELAQETFIFAFERLDQYSPGTNLLAWLRSIARNLARDHFKRATYRRDLMARYMDERLAARAHDLLGARTVDARLEHLEICIESMPEEQRRFLRRVHGRGSTMEAVARALGRTGAAVRKQLSRLHKAIRDCIEHRVAAAEGGVE
jgi:RNA polymerase sigma-70 factor (ECF subfamily)